MVMVTGASFALGFIHATLVLASPLVEPRATQAAPTVKLDSATVTGVSSLTGLSSKFLGIPFAEPPLGSLRFNLPKTISPYTGAISANAFGPSCAQQSITLPLPPGLAQNTTDYLVNTIYNVIVPDSEDCLTINVVKPIGATASSKLPVAVWIFGGGFEVGSTSTYDGSVIVERSIALGEPVVYVSMNYRLNGFGFLASKEVKAAGVGNLGLQDQREALRWVQKYIGQFGGDPTKVTIWGESAGAISVSLHMLSNGGDTQGLFRAGWMESGSPIPIGDISHGQVYYDSIVATTGCSGASNTLSCLRGVPYSQLKSAINLTPGIFAYQSLALAWSPRADGVFLTDNPQKLVASGKVASIPIVNGDNDDEGTLFSFSTLNITTDAQFRTYLGTVIFPNATASDVQQIATAYPNDITQGSPFDTGILNALTPQYKRLAAFFGDAVFQAPRRFFLQSRSGKQKIWSYLSKRLKGLPAIGSVHGSDIANVYLDGEMTDYLINFVNNLDPNGAGLHLPWPQWTTSTPNLMTFLDGLIPLVITQDTYRTDAMNTLTQISLSNAL